MAIRKGLALHVPVLKMAVRKRMAPYAQNETLGWAHGRFDSESNATCPAATAKSSKLHCNLLTKSVAVAVANTNGFRLVEPTTMEPYPWLNQTSGFSAVQVAAGAPKSPAGKGCKSGSVSPLRSVSLHMILTTNGAGEGVPAGVRTTRHLMI